MPPKAGAAAAAVAELLSPPQLAVLWGAQAPPHEVRCAAAVARPPSVWTGGTDGELVRWQLAPEGDAATPLACLLGHTEAVLALVAAPGGPDDDADKTASTLSVGRSVCAVG